MSELTENADGWYSLDEKLPDNGAEVIAYYKTISGYLLWIAGSVDSEDDDDEEYTDPSKLFIESFDGPVYFSEVTCWKYVEPMPERYKK